VGWNTRAEGPQVAEGGGPPMVQRRESGRVGGGGPTDARIGQASGPSKLGLDLEYQYVGVERLVTDRLNGL